MERIIAAVDELNATNGVETKASDPSIAAAGCVRASHAYPLDTATAAIFSSASLRKQYPQFDTQIKLQQERLRKLLVSLVSAVEPACNASALVSELRDPDGDLSGLTEFLDRLRETAESYIDEAKGQHSSQQVASVQSHLAAAAAHQRSLQANTTHDTPVPVSAKRFPTTSNKVREKPQLAFEDTIDNSRDTLFMPKIREKYHALLSVDPSPDGSGTRRRSSGYSAVAYKPTPGIHAYAAELNALAYQPWQLSTVEPQAFVELDDVPFQMVDSVQELHDLVDYLEGSGQYDGSHAEVSDADAAFRNARTSRGAAPVKEIAVDLEAHSIRSFQGFVCLMQLSTRKKDFVIDTIALRSHMHILNRVFADPSVVKVLHGCDGDVVWLQRDFGVFLVNVFDTGQAARLLGYPSFGLAYLMSKFPRVVASKEYQTADWRERPLPPHLIKYAREDTHYLLGIYDRIKNELISGSTSEVDMNVVVQPGKSEGDLGIAAPAEMPALLATALDNTREKTLAVYEKDMFFSGAYKKLMAKLGLRRPKGGPGAGADDGDTSDSESRPQSPRSKAFAALYEFRDALAREEDESHHFVLPNRLLGRIAETRPTKLDELSKCCHPMPHLIRLHATELLKSIAKAVNDAPDAELLRPTAAAPPKSGAKRPREAAAATSPAIPTSGVVAVKRARTEPGLENEPALPDVSKLLPFPVAGKPLTVCMQSTLQTVKQRHRRHSRTRVCDTIGAAFGALGMQSATSSESDSESLNVPIRWVGTPKAINWYEVTGIAQYFERPAPTGIQPGAGAGVAEKQLRVPEAAASQVSDNAEEDIRSQMENLLEPVVRDRPQDAGLPADSADHEDGSGPVTSLMERYGGKQASKRSKQAEAKPVSKVATETEPVAQVTTKSVDIAAAASALLPAGTVQSAVRKHVAANAEKVNPYLKSKHFKGRK